jgi:hypothetical protein
MRVAPEVKAALREIGEWARTAQEPMAVMWRHVGARMGECLREQHAERPCAPCPACAFVRDVLLETERAAGR